MIQGAKRAAVLMLILFAVAFALRVAFLLLVTGPHAPLNGDEPSYHGIAISFLNGDGWQWHGAKSYRAPLISLHLAVLYSLAGISTAAARWCQVVLASAAVPLLFWVSGRVLRYPRPAPFLAGLALALYPPAIYYSGQLVTENMALVLTILFIWSFHSAAGSERLLPALLCGAWAGLMVLNRSSFALFPFFLYGFQLSVAWRSPVRWERMQWIVGLVAFAAVMAPWTVRNYFVHGVFMPTTSQGAFYLGVTNGSLWHPFVQKGAYHKNPELYAQVEGQPEAKWGSIGTKFALSNLPGNLQFLPRTLLNRAKNYWTFRPDPYEDAWTRNDIIMLVFWMPIFLFFVLSFGFVDWRRDWPGLSLIAYLFFITLMFWGTPRFRFPVDMLIIARAFAFVVLLYERLSPPAIRALNAAQRIEGQERSSMGESGLGWG